LQILAEFIRATNVDPSRTFYGELDSILPHLILILHKRGGKYSPLLQSNYAALQSDYPVCILITFCKYNFFLNIESLKILKFIRNLCCSDLTKFVVHFFVQRTLFVILECQQSWSGFVVVCSCK
jgi:hypothetical protein